MTDYYITTTGSDGAAGTSPAVAWATLEHAFATVSAGDDVYIGPGTHYHREDTRAAVSGTSGNSIRFIGDPLGIETGDLAGPVILTCLYDQWSPPAYDHLINWTGDVKFVEFHNLVFMTA